MFDHVVIFGMSGEVKSCRAGVCATAGDTDVMCEHKHRAISVEAKRDNSRGVVGWRNRREILWGSFFKMKRQAMLDIFTGQRSAIDHVYLGVLSVVETAGTKEFEFRRVNSVRV
jgi:hypothetical protein